MRKDKKTGKDIDVKPLDMANMEPSVVKITR